MLQSSMEASWQPLVTAFFFLARLKLQCPLLRGSQKVRDSVPSPLVAGRPGARVTRLEVSDEGRRPPSGNSLSSCGHFKRNSAFQRSFKRHYISIYLSLWLFRRRQCIPTVNSGSFLLPWLFQFLSQLGVIRMFDSEQRGLGSNPHSALKLMSQSLTCLSGLLCGLIKEGKVVMLYK